MDENLSNSVLTLDEAAEYLKISRRYAYELVRRGVIQGFKIGTAWRVTMTALNEYIARQTQQQNPDPQPKKRGRKPAAMKEPSTTAR